MSETAIIRKVDILILGGSSAAVAAALAAHKAGASVFLAAPRNYLGEDICGGLQLHLDADCGDHELINALQIEKANPRELKLVLEDALVKQHVDFIFGSYPVAALHDSDGNINGAIIANRAGRQAIQAKTIIDATARALFARLADAPFKSFEAQTINYRRRMIARADKQVSNWNKIEGALQSISKDDEQIELALYERSDVYELGNASVHSLVHLEQHSYQQSWVPESAVFSEDSIYVLNDRLTATTANDLQALNHESMTSLNNRCYVLSPYADISDELAQTLLKPGYLIPAADALGKHVAAQVKDIASSALSSSSCKDAGAQENLRYRNNGLRPVDSGLEQFNEQELSLPSLGHVDVAVVGGGTGGAPAGIAAARKGAKTVILEFQSHLGGVGTVGQISVYYYGNRIGFTSEIDAGVFGMGDDPQFKQDSGRWAPNWKQAWYHQAATESGADIWYQTTVYGVQMTGDRVTGVLVAGPFGHGLVTCGAVVDATGAAEVAANAGAPVRVINDEHIAVQGTGLSPISPIKTYNNTDHNFIDDEDMVDVTTSMVAAKYKLEDEFDICQLVNSRERQQIVGEWEVSPLDILCDRQFPDTVCRAYSNFDSHGFTIHPLFMIKSPDKKAMYANVPYRALIPQEIDGVLVTGLGVSAHRDSLPLIRMQPDVQNQGYAAGYAAAMSAQQQCGIRDISIKHLQAHLIEKECLETHQLMANDNFPLGDDVLAFMVNEEWDTYRGISVMLAHIDRCKPLIKEAFEASSDEEQRLRYAHILAMLGQDDYVQSLIDYVKNNEWDDGWNYKGMGQFGYSLSRMDTYFVALSKSADQNAVAIIKDKIESLALPCDFSHARGLAIAAAEFQARGIDLSSWIPALQKMLAHEDMSGFAQTDVDAVLAALTPNYCENDVRNRSLREIVLARALWICGDREALTQDTLAAYAQDMRGHFARHAQALLAKAPAYA